MQQPRKAEDAGQRRADLVAHIGQEIRGGALVAVGLVALRGQHPDPFQMPVEGGDGEHARRHRQGEARGQQAADKDGDALADDVGTAHGHGGVAGNPIPDVADRRPDAVHVPLAQPALDQL